MVYILGTRFNAESAIVVDKNRRKTCQVCLMHIDWLRQVLLEQNEGGFVLEVCSLLFVLP